jgi:homopolymeric O-antigen transport system permease protein
MSQSNTTVLYTSQSGQSTWAYLNPLAAASRLWRIRGLTTQFTIREIQGRYKGSYLGLLWSMINPLLMLAVFTFVFGYLFQSRWSSGHGHESIMDYTLNLYGGMIAFNIFSESVVKASTLIVTNPNYVKKVIFPLEVLPLSVIASAAFHALLSLAILLVISAFDGIPPHWTLIYVPVVCVPLILLASGMSWFLAALGVFLRDLGHVISVLVQLLFYLTPIVYPASMLEGSPWAQRLMKFNLMATIVENFRAVVNAGNSPHWLALGVATAVCLVIALAGYAWFMAIKRAFADVL